MFLFYALAAGLLVGWLRGGRIERLADLTFRWVPLALAGLLVQIVLFLDPVTRVVGDAGPPAYILSTVAVLIFVLRNLRIPGLPLVALGAASNLAAILANGGYMPASPAAVALVHRTSEAVYSNSRTLTDPALAPLTDIFPLPPPIPFANVFSVGDLLIFLGVAAAIVMAMGTRSPVRGGNSPE